MNADRRVWKVTFRDGSWVKMIGFADIERAWQQAGHEFGEFATMESLPATDAAVRVLHAAANRNRAVENRKAVEAIRASYGGLALRDCSDVRRNVMRLRRVANQTA